MRTDVRVGVVVIIVSVMLANFTTWFPGWLASPICIAGWCFIGHAFWGHESWIASGTRGCYINPAGDVGNIRVTLMWLFFGIALKGLNVYYRSKWSPFRRKEMME